MTPPDELIVARFTEAVRVVWSISGVPRSRQGWLEVISEDSVRIVTEADANVSGEIRLVVLDDEGSQAAFGVGRVQSIQPGRGILVDLLAFGKDGALLAEIAAIPPPSIMPEPMRPPRSQTLPPPLPAYYRGPAQPIQSLSAETHDFEEELEPLIEPLAVRHTGIVIGIDLGTTNTCASYVQDGRAKIIPGRTGTSTIPSMITFDPDGTFHIGQRAADRQILYPMRTVYGSKRLLGRTYRPELAAELQAHFAYPLDEAEGQRFGVRIDDRVISMDTIAARVLDEVRSSAEAHLKAPIEAAVITVPAYFSEVQREAVRRAAGQAKLAVYRIVNEPTAAAVAYGHNQKTSARIAVWDFGGGTFDFSIVNTSEGQLEVVATGGDNFVGGSDFDDLIASYLLTEFQRTTRTNVDPDPQQIARLREAAEHAKRTLSIESDTIVELPEFTRQPRRNLYVELSREKFDELTASLIERTVAIATEVMHASGLTPLDIDDVLLVGGTTRIPAVQDSVTRLFHRRPSKRINPDEAVALGAALLAEEIGGGSAPTLVDILPMSVGRGATHRRFEPIVSRFTRVPTVCELTLSADVLGSVYVPLFQGESTDVSRNEYLCSVIVEDRSLWDGGRVVLRISFDEHCVMVVDAFDAKTKRGLPVRLDRSRPVADVLENLGAFGGSEPEPEPWRLPETTLGKVLGKLSRLFGRR